MSKAPAEWLPLDESASRIKRSANRIRSQIRNGKLQRGRHFRRGDDGELELNVPAYLRWLEKEKEERGLLGPKWVGADAEDKRGRARKPVDNASKPALSPPQETKSKAKLIPLRVWAQEMFGEYCPHPNTLLNWTKSGKLVPHPIKVGSRYFVRPETEYFDQFAWDVRRMVEGR